MLNTPRIHAIGTTRFVIALETFCNRWGDVFRSQLDILNAVLYEPLIAGKGLPPSCRFSQSWESFVHMVCEVAREVGSDRGEGTPDIAPFPELLE